MGKSSKKRRAERRAAAEKIQRLVRSRSNNKSERAAVQILAKDNKESVKKVEEDVQDIKDMLKEGQGKQKKTKFLKNVLFLSVLGLGGITAYGALDDIKKKLKGFEKARKEGMAMDYARRQFYGDSNSKKEKGYKPETYRDAASRRASYLKDSFLRGLPSSRARRRATAEMRYQKYKRGYGKKKRGDGYGSLLGAQRDSREKIKKQYEEALKGVKAEDLQKEKDKLAMSRIMGLKRRSLSKEKNRKLDKEGKKKEGYDPWKASYPKVLEPTDDSISVKGFRLGNTRYGGADGSAIRKAYREGTFKNKDGKDVNRKNYYAGRAEDAKRRGDIGAKGLDHAGKTPRGLQARRSSKR